MAVIFHIVADSMLVAADGVPGFFPGVAFKNQLDCQETLVQPAVVCRIHRFSNSRIWRSVSMFPTPQVFSLVYAYRRKNEYNLTQFI